MSVYAGTEEEHEAMAKEWPVGTLVDVRRDNGDVHRGEVKYSPWRLGHGAWVIGVRGIAGGYILERVTKVTP